MPVLHLFVIFSFCPNQLIYCYKPNIFRIAGNKLFTSSTNFVIVRLRVLSKEELETLGENLFDFTEVADLEACLNLKQTQQNEDNLIFIQLVGNAHPTFIRYQLTISGPALIISWSSILYLWKFFWNNPASLLACW